MQIHDRHLVFNPYLMKIPNHVWNSNLYEWRDPNNWRKSWFAQCENLNEGEELDLVKEKACMRNIREAEFLLEIRNSTSLRIILKCLWRRSPLRGKFKCCCSFNCMRVVNINVSDHTPWSIIFSCYSLASWWWIMECDPKCWCKKLPHNRTQKLQ